MDEDFFNAPMSTVKRDLQIGIFECQKRCLYHSVKWLAEMSHGLSTVQADWPEGQKLGSNLLTDIDPNEYDEYLLAKSYFDVREYDRAAYFVRNCTSPVPRFIYFYATYMAREKRRLDSITDTTSVNDTTHVKELTDLLTTLRNENSKSPLDGYCLYLYGVVLKALGLDDAAIQVLQQAIRAEPMLWSAHVELAPLIPDKEKLMAIDLNGHWMRHLFVAHTYIDLFMNDEGIKACADLQAAGFRKCIYITSQIALAHHNKRDVAKAIEVFRELQAEDPYRLDNLDIYSNLLFVKDYKTEMAELAHRAVSINKYRPETCCVVGNYYSIRTEHQKAITYFQRALKLNPNYLAAWTLMGHEFMELKNTNAAIQSYRKAVEVNKRDYRAWYGLGQSYEILKMHYYSLYYFKIAHQLRPYDSRMLVALGETYEKLEQNENAIRCYTKASDVGDLDVIASFKLANLYEKIGDVESAVQYYIMYCADERATMDNQSLYQSYMTLANYYERKGMYERAADYAHKCLESDDRKAEAKSLLKTIENKRSMENQIGGKKSHITLSGTTDSGTSDDDMELEDCDFDMATKKFTAKKQLHADSNNTSMNITDTASTSTATLQSDNKETAGSTLNASSVTEAADETQTMEISMISID